ncbi:Serine protease, partial [Trichuris trichiura]
AICGKPFFEPTVSNRPKAGSRIGYGREARPHSYPWQVYIASKFGAMAQTCGGSLLHWKEENASNIILTAAHCIIDVDEYYGIKMANASEITVYLGAHDVQMLGKHVQVAAVSTIVLGTFHKYWRKEDIAILKLDRQVAYNHFIQGICLPSENETLSEGTACVVTGWGDIELGMPSNRLQQIMVFVHHGNINHPNFRRGDMICAGTKMEDSGPRKGDSGSPLACKKNNTYYIQGLVSFRMVNVCTAYLENVAYVKVPKFLKWLEYNIERLQQNLFSK